MMHHTHVTALCVMSPDMQSLWQHTNVLFTWFPEHTTHMGTKVRQLVDRLAIRHEFTLGILLDKELHHALQQDTRSYTSIVEGAVKQIISLKGHSNMWIAITPSKATSPTTPTSPPQSTHV
jgi:hypothetical protein